MKQTDIDLIYENRYYEGNRGMMEEYEDEIQEEVLKKETAGQYRIKIESEKEIQGRTE